LEEASQVCTRDDGFLGRCIRVLLWGLFSLKGGSGRGIRWELFNVGAPRLKMMLQIETLLDGELIQVDSARRARRRSRGLFRWALHT
jgi:hypothetical protein